MSSLKQTIKNAGSAALHFCFKSALVCRGFDWMTYERWRHRRRQIEKRLRDQGLYGDVVEFGPFKGLRFTNAWAGNRFEKIIGAYEAFLHPFVEIICGKPYTEIVNVGSAEGYYVVGFARRISGARVFAYDIKPELLEHCREFARLNGVQDRVATGGFCDPAELGRIPVTGKCLVFSDCEGYELELLDPDKAPMLRTADILVEIHDFKNPAISRTIRERFKATHTLRSVASDNIRLGDYPVLRHLNFPEIYAMTNEERGGIMEWFYLETKTGRD